MENWYQIQKDGMLKSWNRLNTSEKEPIGKQLGDPVHFSDYIMFGVGVSGEIVVNSKHSGKIVMDIDAEYKTGTDFILMPRRLQETVYLFVTVHMLKSKTVCLLSHILFGQLLGKNLD